MANTNQFSQPVEAPEANRPHIFQDVQLMSGSMPFQPRFPGAMYTPPPIPAGKSQVCGLCGKGRHDKNHIDGIAEADAESPDWG
jgi:hypothetical protein